MKSKVVCFPVHLCILLFPLLPTPPPHGFKGTQHFTLLVSVCHLVTKMETAKSPGPYVPGECFSPFSCQKRFPETIVVKRKEASILLIVAESNLLLNVSLNIKFDGGVTWTFSPKLVVFPSSEMLFLLVFTSPFSLFHSMSS